MSRILAIDPGNTESGWCVIESTDCAPIFHDKTSNEHLRSILWRERLGYERAVVEMVASYGMAVGKEVFETCVWVGRYSEAIEAATAQPTEYVYRRDIKLHHCHSSKAKDSNVRQALVDRFAPGQPNHGKGTKANPGWFHGFRADIWQAYALAVYAADQLEGRIS